MSAPGESTGLVLVPDRFAVQVGGREVVLTATQFRLLALLVAEPGRTFSRAELMEGGIGTLVRGRAVDVPIKDMRRKLRLHGSQIGAVRGPGYQFSSTGGPASRTSPPPAV